MTIPPIGPSSISPAQPEDKPNSADKPERIRRSDQPEKAREPQGERVELSAEAKRIRARQAEITRLQVVERTAEAIDREMQEIAELAQRQAAARRTNDAREVERTRNEMDSRVEAMRERANEARYEEENLLDGRAMRFRVNDQEREVRTPDMVRELERYSREIREVQEGRREAASGDFRARLREFMNEARDARLSLERDVRETVANAVRESSTARPRDAEDAERLIRQARRSQNPGTSQRPPGMDQISSKAVNLLQ